MSRHYQGPSHPQDHDDPIITAARCHTLPPHCSRKASRRPSNGPDELPRGTGLGRRPLPSSGAVAALRPASQASGPQYWGGGGAESWAWAGGGSGPVT